MVIARGDMQGREIHLLEAGANAILRLPVTADWDLRLSGLLNVAQRRAARIPVRLDFEGHGGTMIDVVQGTVLNLSTTGMLVETTSPLMVGTDLEFHFALDHAASPLTGRGTVLRVAGTARYGIRFDVLEAEDARAIRSFIDGARDQGGAG